MAVVGLLEHLCSLMDTQPSEVTPLFFEFRIEFFPEEMTFFRTDGRNLVEVTHFFCGRFGRKWNKWKITDIKNKINVL